MISRPVWVENYILKVELMSKSKSSAHLNNLKNWLVALDTGDVKPSIHINSGYNLAVIVVDFGSPVEPIKLNSDQFTEFSKLVKAATKEVINKDTSVRLSVDNGVHWTSI